MISETYNMEERFWSKTNKGSQDECWVWRGMPDQEGYGRLYFNNKVWRSHRASWLIHNGREGRPMVLHSCDNRMCVNPRHLREGTARENAVDMVHRRRIKRKLRHKDVKEIKRRLAAGESQSSLGLFYGVTQAAISSIYLGRTWEHCNAD